MQGAAGLALSGMAPRGVFAESAKLHGREVHVFSKHLQWLDYEAMARAAADIGFDGVDLTVRPGGHVLPENVEVDLPRAVQAVRAKGLKADRITTAIVDPDELDDIIGRVESSGDWWVARSDGTAGDTETDTVTEPRNGGDDTIDAGLMDAGAVLDSGVSTDAPDASTACPPPHGVRIETD